MPARIKQITTVWMIIFLLMVQMLIPLGAQAADLTAEGLILTLEANRTTPASGEEFSYLINYSASSTVQNFKDPTITLTLPASVSYSSKSDSNITTSTVTDSVDVPGSKLITFTFKGGVLPAGSAGQLIVTGKFENYSTPDGTPATATATFHATVDGEPVVLDSNAVTVTSSAAVHWTLEKRKIRPLPDPFKGSDVQYEILFHETNEGGIGNLDIQDITVTDQLPDGAVFVSADNGGTLAAGNRVVWNLDNGLRGSKRLTVIVNYPESITATEVVNQATATFTPLGQPSTSVSAQVTHGFDTVPKDNGTGLGKYTDINDKEISPGQTVKFYISGLENKANVELDNTVVEDMTPTQTLAGTPIDLELQSIRTASFEGIDNYDIYYTLVENPTAGDWQYWKTVTASTVSAFDTTSLGMVKGLQYRFGKIPVNFIQTTSLELTYKVPATFPVSVNAAETVKNTAQLSYDFAGSPNIKNVSSTFDIVGDRPLLKLEKSSSKTNMKPTESTTFTLKATNNAPTSSANLDNPVLVDVLPAEFDYVPGSWKVTKPAGLPLDPTFTAEPQSDGTTKLTWSWDAGNPGSLKIGEAVTVTFDATLKAGTQQKTIVNTFYVNSPTYLNDINFSNKKCAGCEPAGGAPFSVKQAVNIRVDEEVALQSAMWVKGELDSEWSKYPDTGTTTPGGHALYQLKIANVGNVPTKDLTIVNTFARIGDTAVMNGAVGRSSKWGPLLTGPVIVPSYVKAYYSTKPGITMNPTTGEDNGVWEETPPQDLTSVTAVKFVFDDSFIINPLDTTTLEWPMVAPVGSPSNGDVAWNSFGYKMNKVGGGSILPAEPLKVGIQTLASPKAEIGDHVWLDQNENGIQDAGEIGVNGIKVELYNEAGTKLSETLTGNDFAGNPGSYLFPNLDPGNYRVVFSPTSAYDGLTKAGQGADASKDSDADPMTGKTALITLADGEKQDTVDAGLIPKKGVLGDTVWLDSNGNGVQDAGEAGMNGVKVDLYNSSDQLLASTTTSTVNGEDGIYSFKHLQPGDYKIKFELPSATYAFTTPNSGVTPVITLGQGEENLTLDAGMFKLPTGSIGDFVWFDTNQNGIQDPDENGLNQIKVQLFNDNNQLVAETLTADKDGQPGYYLFDNLETGVYYLKFVGPYTSTKKHAGANPDADSDINAKGRIDLTTLHPGEHLTSIDAGLYQPAGSQDPQTPQPTPGSLGDRVWIDTNRNGLQDADEPGINGVQVDLYDGKHKLVRSVVTADKDGQPGHYLFDQLEADVYQVEFHLPSKDFTFTSLLQGTAYEQDSDVTPDTGRTRPIALGIGEQNISIDAGLLPAQNMLGQLGNTVWLDTNANGVQDEGEPGVNDVTLELYDADGKLLSTTKTRTKSGRLGFYMFTNLLKGTYTVKFTAPDGYAFTSGETSVSKTVQLGEGEANLTLNRGLVKKGGTPPSQPSQPSQPDPTPPAVPSGEVIQPSKSQGTSTTTSPSSALLPQTGEQPSPLPWFGLVLVVLAGTLLTIRKYKQQ